MAKIKWNTGKEKFLLKNLKGVYNSDNLDRLQPKFLSFINWCGFSLSLQQFFQCPVPQKVHLLFWDPDWGCTAVRAIPAAALFPVDPVGRVCRFAQFQQSCPPDLCQCRKNQIVAGLHLFQLTIYRFFIYGKK